MLEKYYKYKFEFRDYIIFIKSGIFYECIGKDALIINKIFNYRISKISNTFKVGFPIKNIEYVINNLRDNNINYIIVSNDIEDKYECENNNYNNYNNYNFNIDNILYNFLVVEKIIKYLEDNIMTNKLEEKLKMIVNILEEE